MSVSVLSGLPFTKGSSDYFQTVATFNDAGGLQDASRYTAMIDWGDGQATPGIIGGGLSPRRHAVYTSCGSDRSP